MHNIHELEQKWFKYKIKFFLPYVVVIIFFAILIITLIFINDFKSISPLTISKKEYNISKQKQSTKVSSEQNIEEETIDIKKDTEQKINKKTSTKPLNEIKDSKDEKLILSPSLDFMKKLKTDSVNSYNDVQTKSYNNISEEISKNISEDTVKEEKTIQTYQDQDTQESETFAKKPKITISKRETQNDIQDVIKRFKKNNNPALSLFVAKKYYKLGDYEKAYNYALITNEINNEIEQSWIIFAKSLVKLNKKDLAIKTLKKYIRHSHSGNAKVLLEDIKSGKFR
ncbi:hypothetical protein FJR48_04470 [Sulfurimonas lithotrophica]|uniref:Transformation system protein n=1 Tax=Sulfurimonas lithotrophica TaxID=2590022 RepID=A0A5P8P0B5_9BACT|nr:CDC27 family protein [Sulfurimonas lithotrophica]QFR49017.1 hypothetical protein FJR48_04470 [Sulfurimonas lithotrophica]